MKRKNNKQTGSILIFVLVLIVLLSVIATRLMQETIQEMRYVSQQHFRDNLRTHAYSVLDLSIGVLNEFRMIERNLHAPSQGWGDPLGYADIEPLESNVKWNVRIIDESGKVPFSSAREKDMVYLFATMVSDDSLVDEDDGQPFYDALMDWQDADDNDRDEGAEDDYYEDLSPPYFTPGQKIENFEEFRMIKGFAYDFDDPENSGIFYGEDGRENQNFKNFRNSFSFFHDGSININGAPEFLLRFLCGENEGLYEDLKAGPSSYSKESSFFTSMNDPVLSRVSKKSGIRLGTNASMFRLVITVSKGKANFKLHAVVGVDGVGNRSTPTKRKKKIKPRSQQNQKIKYPFRVLSLRENENLID
ncbi:general secretion pathway protein GspK [bacterium]|nr:general secretion pathway protein GspK [bacterium]